MKKYLSFWRTFTLFTTVSCFQYEAKAQLVGIWSGTVSMTIRSETMVGWGETHINTSFTDNKGYGTIKFDGGGKLIAGTASCHGQGVAELHDVYYAADNTYYIYVIGPECLIGPDPKANHQNDILIADEPIPANPKYLSGTRKTVTKLDNLGGTATITLTWDLATSTDIDEPCMACGSIIRIENQSLGQAIAITGTSLALQYNSNHNPYKNSSQYLGGWTLNSQHSLIGRHLLLGNGSSFSIEGDLKPVLKEIAGVVPAEGYLITSGDGSEIYALDNAGHHLRTFDAVTGALIHDFRYDDKKQLTGVIDAYGSATTIERDRNGFATAIIGPYGHKTELTIDTAQNLVGIVDPSRKKNSFSYSASGLLSGMIDSRGFNHSYEYDLTAKLIKDKGPSGGFTSIKRNTAKDSYTITVITSLGNTTKYRITNHSGGLRERTVTFADGTSNTEMKWSNGREEVKFANGVVETHIEEPGKQLAHRLPLPAKLILKLPSGLMTTLIAKRTLEFEDANNPLSLTRLVDSLNLNGTVARSIYTANNKTLKEFSPLGRLLTTVFDNKGQVSTLQIEGLAPLIHSYDSQGRLISTSEESQSEKKQFHYKYDAAGNLDTIIDPLGRVSHFIYDVMGRKTGIFLPGGSVIGFDYDDAGNINQIKPPGQPAHMFEYDNAGQMTRYTAPDIGKGPTVTSYEYNLDQQLTHIYQPDGRTINFEYNAGGCSCGKLGLVTEPRGKHSYTYLKASGQLSTLSSPDGVTISFGYDGSLPTTQTWTGPVKGQVKNGYDNNFGVVSHTINGAAPITYKTDADGLLVKAGNMLLVRNPLNGYITSTRLEKITETIAYNDFAKKISSVVSFGNTSIYNAQYIHDKLGRIITRIEMVGSVTDTSKYDYDLTGRLAIVIRKDGEKTIYSYDDNGNRLTVAKNDSSPVIATYDKQDRLIQFGNNTYTYTANGDLLSKAHGAITTKYDYDVFGNLIKVSLPDSKVIDYIIDGYNRRIGRKLNGILQKGFLYQDDLRIVAELDGQNNVKSRFVYASRMYVPDFMIRDGITYRIISDNTGSPRLVVDVITGSVAQRMNYDESGNVIEDSNPGFQPFGFTGGLYDPDTKLTRFGARDYDAAAGRWTSKDPILFGGFQANLYTYVSNDPLNQKDPTGRGVKVCRQTLLTFEFPKGLSHWWLETSTVKQGMGRSPRGGLSVKWVDQTYKYGFKGEKIICEDYPTVDEECVNANTTGELGTYGFVVNNCQDAVLEVLKKCDRGPKPPPPPGPLGGIRRGTL